VQAVLLKRQVAELERRIETLTQSERKSRADLLEALGASQAATQEQARLHEQLAARERVVTEIVTREADASAELAAAKANLASATAGANRHAAAEAAALAAKSRAAELAAHVEQRARILGFLAEDARQQRRRLTALRARLDAGNLAVRAQGRAVIDAALAARGTIKSNDQKTRAERWQAWTSSALPPRGAPKRRNRPKKMLEKILCRLGPLGVAAAIGGSGLWNRDYQADTRPASRRSSLLGYAGSRPSPEAMLQALFDQSYYLANNPSVAAARHTPLAHYLVHGDGENRSPHPLVDVRWYRASNPHELGSTGLTVLQHFLFIGAAKGLNPHPLFDVKYYVGQLSDPADQMLNPLVHYLRTGWRRGFNPHPLFDNDGYLRRYPDVAGLMIPPLLHYVTTGAREGRDPHPLFSGQWYQSTYPDVVSSGQLPLAHFIDKGAAERRHPNPHFNSQHYLRSAPEAHSSDLDPLQHYIEAGAWKGVSPLPAFDPHAFLAVNPSALNSGATPLESWITAGCPPLDPDTIAHGTDLSSHRSTLLLMFDAAHYAEQAGDFLSPTDDLLDHYLAKGWRLGFNPNRLFDTAWYADRYPEAAASGLSPLVHFVAAGAAALNDPHPLFDSRWYAERYADVAEGKEIPIVHYLHFGGAEGRSPGPLFDAAAYLRAYPDVRGVNPLIHFLTRWPLDNRPNGFHSAAAGSPRGADLADWAAGLADSLVQAAGRD
jgi:hypothetical protein